MVVGVRVWKDNWSVWLRERFGVLGGVGVWLNGMGCMGDGDVVEGMRWKFVYMKGVYGRDWIGERGCGYKWDGIGDVDCYVVKDECVVVLYGDKWLCEKMWGERF